MMKSIVITQKGAEDVSLAEIKSIAGAKGKKGKGVVFFDASAEQLCGLCYHGRSFRRVIELLCSFEFSSLDEIGEKAVVKGFEAESFAVHCIREGEHDFSSVDVEKLVGDKVNCKVDLKNPQKILLAYVSGKNFYLGIDYSGFDLGKRHYKIFSHPASLRGDVAYSLLGVAGYSGKGVLVDPFCGSGTIVIEAALYAANKSVHFFEKEKFAFLKFMKYEFKDEPKKAKDIFGLDFSQNAIINAKKNAKIAVAEAEFTKAGVDWLDTKFGEKSVDFIATNPPRISKKRSNSAVLKAYDELFHCARYALAKKGVAAVITPNPAGIIEAARKNGLGIKKETGLAGLAVIVFQRNEG